MTASATYTGTVFHRRTATRSHAFRHRITLHYLDLDDVQIAGRRFRRADYLGDPQVGLRAAVQATVLDETGLTFDGPVRLLTQLRSFGHSFNPVSFYYCFDREERLAAIVAEVTNTPWGERHAYVLAPDETGAFHGTFPKRLHVSPFFGLDQTYEWSATSPGEELAVRFDTIEHGARVFEAGITLSRRPFRARRGYGSSLRTLALIYAHAFALRAKGVRPVPHPGVVTREATR